MDDNERKKFGELLKRLRIENGLSLRQVEKEVGISNSYLYQIERGERNAPKLEILRNLAALYKVSFDSLMAAARLQEPEDNDLYYDHIENAFEMVRRDKDFVFGTQMTSTGLSVEAKRFVIEAYQKATGLSLLDKIKRGE